MVQFSSPASRRKFLKLAASSGLGSVILSGCLRSNSTSLTALETKDDAGFNRSNPIPLAGTLLTTSTHPQPRIDLLSLKDGRVLKTFEGIRASHAVVPVESLNRFFVHGLDTQTNQGIILGIETNPETEDWSIVVEQRLEGGNLLHWQPNFDFSLIQYNAIGGETLHVLDPKTLDLSTYQGAGTHSNMAFFKDDRWLVTTDHLGEGTWLKVIDRVTDKILSETPVGNWGHGVTVNDRTGRAFVWASEGVHMVSLAQRNLGQHLGVISPLQANQRSWFCWTPQGGRYSHDQTFNEGDRFSPWLTVLDMEKAKLEKIETPGEQAGTLQISPDGKFGICGSHNSNNVCLFDIEANTLMGVVAAGNRDRGFFDRDAAFSKDRRFAFVTNPPDQTVTVIDISKMKAIGEISLPAKSEWMKVLTL